MYATCAKNRVNVMVHIAYIVCIIKVFLVKHLVVAYHFCSSLKMQKTFFLLVVISSDSVESHAKFHHKRYEIVHIKWLCLMRVRKSENIEPSKLENVGTQDIPSTSNPCMRNVARPSRSSLREWWEIFMLETLSIKNSILFTWLVTISLA